MKHRLGQHVMRWFTHEWHDSELSETQIDAAIKDYATHLADLTPHLPADVRTLAALYLHDAQVQEWTSDETSFSWRLLIGDLQRDYEFAAITYHDAELIGAGAAGLRDARLTDDPVELLSDEIDITADGTYEHRFHLYPGHEFGVRFASVTVHLSPASGGDRR